MQVLNFDEPFHPAYGLVTMPENMFVYYRGYELSYPPISNRPAYYGSLKTAQSYAGLPGRNIAAFTNIRPLELIDVRFMKDILREMFRINKPDKDTLPVVLSFGLCSLRHQCILAIGRFHESPHIQNNVNALINYYKSNITPYFEQPGYRIGETTNDAYTMAFLRTIFEGFVDGFISPAERSPFHIEKTTNIHNAELIIFNPEKSGIRMFHTPPPVLETSINIEWLYARDIGKKIHLGKPKYPYNLYTLSGGGNKDTNNTLPSVEQIQIEWNTNPIIRENWKKGEEAGIKWKEIVKFGIAGNPHPKADKLGDWNNISVSYQSIEPFSIPIPILLKSDTLPKHRFTRKNTKNYSSASNHAAC
jgi:hypothetical protein